MTKAKSSYYGRYGLARDTDDGRQIVSWEVDLLELLENMHDASWSGVVNALSDAVMSVPEEHRDACKLYVERGGYEDPWIAVLTWSAPETFEEMAGRVAAERADEAARRAEVESRERAQLARLREKYGDGSAA